MPPPPSPADAPAEASLVEEQRDALTGLPGLAAVRARLAAWAAQGEMVHALLLGLRRFETINLAYGAAAGDGALVAVAERLRQFATNELEGGWLAARGPGGTFFVIAKQPCSRERWQMFAAQLADRVARPIIRRAGTLRLSPRIALVRVLDGEAPASVLDRLAQTLANATRGQGRRVIWPSGEAALPGHSAAALEADVLRAIDAGAIEVVFQPQFTWDEGGGQLIRGAEALARWNHPSLGQIGAGALFAIAERADHVAPLSRHIAALALTAAADWPAPLRLSLNVTAQDLAAGDFVGSFTRTLARSGFAADRLTIEVTEQVLLTDLELAARSLSVLAALGIRMALDDFGAGFCNFRYLKVLPLHALKLDRSMIDGIAEAPRDLAVLRALVAMARALDLEVIAEGVETEAQRAVIRREGIAAWQGFLGAAPMAEKEFLARARAS